MYLYYFKLINRNIWSNANLPYFSYICNAMYCMCISRFNSLERAHWSYSDRALEQFHNVIVVNVGQFILILIRYVRINNMLCIFLECYSK